MPVGFMRGGRENLYWFLICNECFYFFLFFFKLMLKGVTFGKFIRMRAGANSEIRGKGREGG